MSMVVGVLRLTVYLPANQSLKGKRAVLRKLKALVANEFNVSIAESGDHDHWQRAVIGVAHVGSDQGHVDGELRAVLRFIEDMGTVEVGDDSIEILHYGT
jgi:uncharacterized protein YlxP (DUF503 family)